MTCPDLAAPHAPGRGPGRVAALGAGRSVLGRAALGASLALNLVLGGVLWWRPDAPPGGPGAGARRMEARVEHLLSGPDRDAFARAMARARPRREAAQAALREARGPLDGILRREPFDPAAMRAAMAEGRSRWREFGDALDEGMVDAMAAISPEGRRRIADDVPGDRGPPDRVARRDNGGGARRD